MQQVSLEAIRTIAEEARGAIDRIFLHWSAGHYNNPSPHYHINITGDGAILLAMPLTEVGGHTYMQNTGSVGVSILCCADAVVYADGRMNFGSVPPTQEQVDMMVRVVAVLCQGLGLPCDYDHVRTHAEQADLDGYGPATTFERWDLWGLPGIPAGQGGEAIRQAAASLTGAA